MRKLGLVGSLLVVSAGWHALGACTGDEPIAGVLDAGNKDAALPEAGPPGEGGVASPKLTASAPRAMLRQGGTVEVALTLSRDGLEGDVAVSVTGLPKGVTAEPAVFAGTSTAAKLVLKAAADATLGDATLSLEAKGAPALPFSLLVAGASGTLDTTFDTDGILYLPVAMGVLHALSISSDGSFVVAGGKDLFNGGGWTAARFGANGAADLTFEAAVRSALPAGGQARAAMVDAVSGKIVLAGNSGTSPERTTIVRLLPTGAGDSGFGKQGLTVSDAFSDRFGSIAHAVAVLSNGDVVVAGQRKQESGAAFGFVEKYIQSGVIDRGFVGYTTTADATFSGLFQVGSGGWVVTGTDLAKDPRTMLVVKLRPDGTADATFGAAGRTLGADCNGATAALSPTGDVLVAGRRQTGPALATCLGRVSTSGSGGVGYETTFGNPVSPETGVATTPDDRVYVGSSGGPLEGSKEATIQRFDARGKPDPSFGEQGKCRIPPTAAGFTTISALATLPDGRLLVLGNDNNKSPFVARYWP